MNRDTNTGVGDYEVTDTLTNPPKPCLAYYVQARKNNDASIIYNSPEEVKFKLNQGPMF
jgi:hypothetical protein